MKIKPAVWSREMYLDLLTSVDPFDTPIVRGEIALVSQPRKLVEQYYPPSDMLWAGMSFQKFLWVGIGLLMAIPLALVGWAMWAIR